jgi:hypothetical protein
MSGDGIAYTPAEAAEVYEFLSDAISEWDSTQGRGGDFLGPRLTVEARVEWAGEYTKRNNGMRTVRLEKLDSGQIRALRNAVNGRSYSETGWHAKLSKLTETSKGRAAMESAGISVSRRTLLGWLSESQAPNKANQARLNEAYLSTKQDTIKTMTARELTRQLKKEYNENVRFRDIKSMKLE